MKKYEISYCSGPTGFGWDRNVDTIGEVEYFIEGLRNDYTAEVKVWDNVLRDFVYWKSTLSYEGDRGNIDMLHSFKRDLRTTTREWKYASASAAN